MAQLPLVLLNETAGRRIFSWGPMAFGDTCDPLHPSAGFPLAMSAQFEGTFGGAVVLEGSNDGVTYRTLKDVSGGNISLTAGALVEISVSCRYVRPNPGTGVSAVTVTLCMRG